MCYEILHKMYLLRIICAFLSCKFVCSTDWSTEFSPQGSSFDSDEFKDMSLNSKIFNPLSVNSEINSKLGRNPIRQPHFQQNLNTNVKYLRFHNSTQYQDGEHRILDLLEVLVELGGVEELARGSCYEYLCSDESGVCARTADGTSTHCVQLDLVKLVATIKYRYLHASRFKSKILRIFTIDKHLLFYREDEKRLTLNKTITLNDTIIHLEIVENFDAAVLSSKRLLLVLLRSRLQIMEVRVDGLTEEIECGNPFSWQYEGTQFKSFQNVGRLLVGLINENRLIIHKFLRKMDSFEWIKMEELSLSTLKFWIPVTSGKNSFIFIFSQHVAEAFVLKGDTFIFIQSLKLPLGETFERALQSKLPNSDQEFLVVQTSEAIHLYKFDAFMFKFSFQESLRISCENMWVLQSEFNTILVVGKKDSFEMHSLEMVSQGNYPKVDIRILKKIRRLKGVHQKQMALLNKMESKLSRSVSTRSTVQGDIFIQGRPDFREPIVPHGIEGRVDEEGFRQYHQQLKDVGERITKIKSTIHTIKAKIVDCVPLSGPNRKITGPKYFFGLRTSVKELLAESVHLNNYKEGQPDSCTIVDIMSNLVRRNDARHVQGSKSFTGNVRVDNLWSISLSGIKTSDLVLANEYSHIKDLSYVNKLSVKEAVNMENSFNHLDLSKEVALLKRNSSIGHCSFEDIEAAFGVWVRSHLINGKHFLEEANSLMKITEDSIIPGSVTLGNIISVDNLIAKEVMGVDLEIFLSEAVFKKEKSQRRSSLKRIKFLSVFRCNDISVNGRINEDIFPYDFVHKTKGVVFFGTKYFDKVYFDKLNVNGFVNSLKVSNIVTKRTFQNISAKKSFLYGLKILSKLDVHSGLVDRVNLHLLSEKFKNYINFNQTLVFKDRLIVSSLYIEGKINGLNIVNISNDLVYKDASAVISGKKSFVGSFKAEKIYIKDLNGIMIDSLVKTTTTVVMNSAKHFQRSVLFNDLTTRGLIDQVNITTLLEESLYLNKPGQFVDGRKSFNSLSSKSIDVEMGLDNLELDTLLTKSTEQNFVNAFDFSMESLSRLKTTSINVINYTINSLDLRDYEKKLSLTTSLDDDLVIIGDLLVKDIKTSRINSIKIEDILEMVQKREESIVLIGDLIFDELDVLGPITSVNKMLEQVSMHAVNLTGMNTISAVEWETVNLHELAVTDYVNDLDLPYIEANSIYMDKSLTSIKGKKTFLNGFVVIEDINVNQINGHNLGDNLLSQTSAQVITAPYTFENILVQSAFIDKFNNINLEVLKGMKLKREQHIYGDYQVGGMVRTISLEVDKLVEGINIESLLGDSIRTDEQFVKIKGVKILDSLSFGNVSLKYINEYDLEKALVSFNGTLQEDLNELVVHGKIGASRIVASSILLTKDSFDVVKYMKENYKILEEAIQEELEFEDCTIEGHLKMTTLNGINPLGYFTQDTAQVISQPVALSNARLKNIQIRRMIGGVYPSSLILDEKTSERTQVFSGSLASNEPIKFSGSVTAGGTFGVSKIKVPKHIIQLSTKGQTIKGEVKFASLSSKDIQSSSNLLNGINLTTLNESFVIIKKALQNEYGLVDTKNPSKDQFDNYLNTWKQTFEHECRRLLDLQFNLSKTIALPTHLELVYHHRFAPEQLFSGYNKQQFYFSEYEQSHFESPVKVFQALSKIWMLSSPDEKSCNAALYSWDEEKRRFIFRYLLSDVGRVHRWLVSEDRGIVSILAVSSGSECNKGSPLWRMESSLHIPTRLVELRPARDGFIENIDDGSILYLNSGMKTLVNELRNGYPTKNRASHKHLDFLKSFKGLDGSKVVVRIWNSRFAEIVLPDTTISLEGFPLSHAITAIIHGDEVALVISATIVMSEARLHYLYVLKRQGGLFKLKSTVSISSPVNLFSFSVSRRNFTHHFIVLLQPRSTPLIFKLEDMSTLQKWAELPHILKSDPWAEVFSYHWEDSEDVFLAIGDRKKVFVTNLKWNAKADTGKTKNCLP